MTIGNINETIHPERAFYELIHLMRYYQPTINDKKELVLGGTDQQLKQLSANCTSYLFTAP